MAELTKLTLKGALEGLKAKTFSAEELARAHVDAIEAANPHLNAYILMTPEKAIEMAKASDARRARGEAGPLEGASLGVKDLFCTEGVQSTAGSKILQGFKPPYESTVTSNLWRDGAVMLDKLNMDEFAMGSSNETSAFGPVANPWKVKGSNQKLTPGGSSGGSASAVAADLCLAATASDTGGSIRQPAAFTGTVGIKPTYGRASRYGMVAFASSLDQAGPIAKTVEDAALLLTSMCGHDPRDSTSLDLKTPDFAAFVGKSVKGLRIGIPTSTAWTACRARSRRSGIKGWPGSKLQAAKSNAFRCPTPNTRFRPITSSHRPRPPPTSLATTACATAFVWTPARSSTPTSRPAPRASAPRSNAAS